MAGLTSQEITRIVNRYVGVNGGYLGDFSYQSHSDFYSEYCDLDIDPYTYEGTTRVRFITILKSSAPDVQAKIVRGVLARFPVGASMKPSTRNQELYDELLAAAQRVEGQGSIATPNLQITSEVVLRAIGDVETLLKGQSAVSGVDRVHTALHGYLRAVCEKNKIPFNNEDSMAKLFRQIRVNHPAFQDLGPRPEDMERVLQSMASIMDALNPIRNKASVAHPNEELLQNAEAMLVINAARTLLHYLDAKLGA